MPLDDHPEAAVRFFSGVARYRATFGWSRPAEAVWLDLSDWRESDLGYSSTGSVSRRTSRASVMMAKVVRICLAARWRGGGSAEAEAAAEPEQGGERNGGDGRQRERADAATVQPASDREERTPDREAAEHHAHQA